MRSCYFPVWPASPETQNLILSYSHMHGLPMPKHATPGPAVPFQYQPLGSTKRPVKKYRTSRGARTPKNPAGATADPHKPRPEPAPALPCPSCSAASGPSCKPWYGNSSWSNYMLIISAPGSPSTSAMRTLVCHIWSCFLCCWGRYSLFGLPKAGGGLKVHSSGGGSSFCWMARLSSVWTEAHYTPPKIKLITKLKQDPISREALLQFGGVQEEKTKGSKPMNMRICSCCAEALRVFWLRLLVALSFSWTVSLDASLNNDFPRFTDIL